MELNKTENILSFLQKTYEGSVEQSVDTDFSLPDYYPEISKILKCISEVNIASTQCSENGVNIGGQVAMTVLYCDPEGQLNSFSHCYPFSKNVECKCADGCFAEVSSNVNYLNTKAVGPRKIEIHGSVTLSITATGIGNDKIISAIDCEDMFVKPESYVATFPLPRVNKSVFIEDEIIIPQTKPSVAKILRSNAVAKITESKFIGEKAVVKGDVEIEILYCPTQNGRPVLIKEEREFSQMTECGCLDGEVDFDASVKVTALEIRPKTSLDGEVRNILFEAKVNVDFYPFKTKEIELVSDIISCKKVAEIHTDEILLENIIDRFSENFVCKKTFDYSGGALSEIYDLWVKPIIEYVTTEGDDVVFKGFVQTRIIGIDSDNETVVIERNLDFEHRHKCSQPLGNIRCRHTAFVAALNKSINDDSTVDIAIEMNVSATVFEQKKELGVVSVDLSDTPIQKDNGTAVVLYFAENETAWNVAKRYMTSPKALCLANNIQDVDTLCNKMLLIPMV